MRWPFSIAKLQRTLSWLKKIGLKVTAVLLILGIAAILVYLTVELINSEFREAQITTLGPLQQYEYAPGALRANVMIKELKESNNTAELTFTVWLRSSTLLDSVCNGVLHMKFVLEAAYGEEFLYRELTPALTVVLDSSSKQGPKGSLITSSTGEFPMIWGIDPFPFDKHHLFLWARQSSTDGHWYHLPVTVTKMPASRVLKLEGTSETPQITLQRPLREQVFVIATSLIAVVVTSFLAFNIHRAQDEAGRLSQLISVAGLVIGLAGFRSLIRIENTPQFTLLEIIVMGVPMVVLGIGFLRVLLIKMRSSSTKP